MKTPEFPTSPEMHGSKLGVLVVLGKNIGVDWTKDRIRKTTSSLSPWSCLNVNAAGKLYREGVTRMIIFSSGYTAGKDVRSEAQAMKDLLKQKFPKIPDRAIILEEKSLDTASNAKEVSAIIKKHEFENIGLLTIGATGHLRNAKKLFASYGIKIENSNGFASEEVIAERTSNPFNMLENFRNAGIIKKERLREVFRSLLLCKDPKGKLLREITKRSRK